MGYGLLYAVIQDVLWTLKFKYAFKPHYLQNYSHVFQYVRLQGEQINPFIWMEEDVLVCESENFWIAVPECNLKYANKMKTHWK